MVEVECPYCEKDIDLGSDTSGMYECPHCSEVFEHMGSEISDENLELIDEIQNGSHDRNIIFSKYKSGRDYKWYHILFQCLLIPAFFGIFMLLETYWNIRKSKSSQSLVVYLEDEESIFQYQILDFKPFSVEKLSIDKKMEISWRHRPGSDGAVRPNMDYYTIISSNDERINFVATDGQKCKIKSFAEAKNIAIRKTHYMEDYF
tara:strand:- start:27 stop:638 length:612 start_codon:yes stop_codon:yes gene_type:complete